MALGDAYATVAELKGYAEHMDDDVDDTQIGEVLLLASRAIEHHCRRQFNKTATASARVFSPATAVKALVDDFHTTTDLVIKLDSGDDGTYETTLTSSQYTLEPRNGVVDGESGWPYWRIRLTTSAGTWLPLGSARGSVQVTAQWGWNAVPTAVKVSCVYLALEAFKLKGAPFGVANFDQFGPIRVRDNPKVMGWLYPYTLRPVLVA